MKSFSDYELSRDHHKSSHRELVAQVLSLNLRVDESMWWTFRDAYNYDAEGKLAGRKKAFLVEVRSDRYKGLGWYAGWELAHPGVPVVNVTLGHGYERSYPADTVFPAAPDTKRKLADQLVVVRRFRDGLLAPENHVPLMA